MLYLILLLLLSVATANKGNNSPPGRQRVTFCHCDQGPGEQCQTFLDHPLPSWENGHSGHQYDCLGPCPCEPANPCAGNLPPVVSCSYPLTAIVGTEVTFDCSATTDPEGSLLTFVFNPDSGTGSTPTSGTFSYTYTSTGPKTATVEITDDCGNTVVVELPVEIFPISAEKCFDELDNERLNGEPNGLVDCADSVCDNQEKPFYNGPPGTENVGECRAGSLRCIGGAIAIDLPPILPSPDVCDGLDNDCDGEVDNDPTHHSQWFLDNDGDGFGDPNTVVLSCFPPPGYTGVGGDCNDNDNSVYPGAPLICINPPEGLARDGNCDGVVDFDFQTDVLNCGACGVSVNDNNACTIDTCVAGVQTNTPVIVSDGILCTVDSCDAQTGVISHVPQNNFCEDNNACTSNVCSATQDCIFPAVADGTDCTFGPSEPGKCAAGVCTDIIEFQCFDGIDNDNNGLVDCADADCAVAQIACSTGLGGACDAGVRNCSIQNGQCLPTAQGPLPDDDNNCGTCGHVCGAGTECNGGTCLPICVPLTCQDVGATCGTISNGCGGVLSCGSCQIWQTCTANNQCGPTPCDPDCTVTGGVNCYPANTCCGEFSEILFSTLGNSQPLCTGNEVICGNCEKKCVDFSANDVEFCGTTCNNLQNCNDDNECTIDSCIGGGFKSCQNTPITDGTACNGTSGDTCQSGVCACTPTVTCASTGAQCGTIVNDCGKTVNCGSASDGNACNGVETCDNGVVVPGTPLVCNDNNPCTNDVCLSESGCKFNPTINACNASNGEPGQCFGGSCFDILEMECSDGIDNDNNGLIDCEDLDCEGVTVPGNSDCNVGVCQGGQVVYVPANNDGFCGGDSTSVCVDGECISSTTCPVGYTLEVVQYLTPGTYTLNVPSGSINGFLRKAVGGGGIGCERTEGLFPFEGQFYEHIITDGAGGAGRSIYNKYIGAVGGETYVFQIPKAAETTGTHESCTQAEDFALRQQIVGSLFTIVTASGGQNGIFSFANAQFEVTQIGDGGDGAIGRLGGTVLTQPQAGIKGPDSFYEGSGGGRGGFAGLSGGSPNSVLVFNGQKGGDGPLMPDGTRFFSQTISNANVATQTKASGGSSGYGSGSVGACSKAAGATQQSCMNGYGWGGLFDSSPAAFPVQHAGPGFAEFSYCAPI